ncbi:MAG: exopolyphosphatase [Actinomycetales bacterium mxb001]|nr:MAG: exopolyphosphatase [Actinomycetales bacterium mxb001]
MRVAAIDCGTNSIRLLVADVVDDSLTDIDRRMEVVRLGEGVDRTGRFSDAALERTFVACERYAEVIEREGAERVRFVATSASRDVDNRTAFVDGVVNRLGVEPDVITGSEEAHLSFTGAVRGLALADSPRLVVDIGGGSTEFVMGDRVPDHAISVDIGCVRMTERCLRSDPPTGEEVDAATADIDAAIDRALAVVPAQEAASLIGVAGSVTTVAAIALDLPTYDPARIHGSVISAAEVEEVTARLLAMARTDRAAMPVMHPGRVDVIGGGALILRQILRRTGQGSVIVSEHDILDGIAWALASG